MCEVSSTLSFDALMPRSPKLPVRKRARSPSSRSTDGSDKDTGSFACSISTLCTKRSSPKLCSGGGAGRCRGHRSRSPRAARDRPSSPSPTFDGVEEDAGLYLQNIDPAHIFFPPWQPQDVDAILATMTLFVSVGDCSPAPIRIPSNWSQAKVECALAEHIGAKLDWLHFTWAMNDVFIDYSDFCPLLSEDDFALVRTTLEVALSTSDGSAPPHRQHALVAGLGIDDPVGNRNSAFTNEQPELVRSFVTAVATIAPDVTFSAIKLFPPAQEVSVATVGTHSRSTVALPLTISDSTWIWIQNDFGSAPMTVGDVPISGSWLPFNRIYHLAANRSYVVRSADAQGHIALLDVAANAGTVDTHLLVQLGFPLGLSILEDAGPPDSAQPAPPAPVRPSGSTDTSAIGAPAGASRHSVALGPRARSPERPWRQARLPRQGSQFQQWVTNKLLAIEAQQQEILALLKSQNAGAKPLPAAPASGMVLMPSTASSSSTRRPAIGARIRAHDLVSGGAQTRTGDFFARSLVRYHAEKCWRQSRWVTLKSTKGKPLVMDYTTRISSRQLLTKFAAKKRVGRPYLSLRVPAVTGQRLVAYQDPPVFANWHGRTLAVLNARYSILCKPSVEAVKKLERDTDHMVDNFVPAPDSLLAPQPPLLSIDELPVRVQKCAAPPGTRRARHPRRAKKKILEQDGAPQHSGTSARGSAEPLPEKDHKVKFRFKCKAHVPCEWTLGQVLDSLRQHLTVENCVVEAGQGRFAIQLNVNCADPNPTTPVHGAGRSFRVQQDTVAKNAVAFLWADLECADGLSFSRKFAETVVLRDRKCALATFQASTSTQRLRAFAAALARMGLPDKAQEVLELPGHPRNPQGQQEAEATAPKRPRVAQVRVRALEAWAHALDSQLTSGEDESDRAAIRARELLDVMAKQA
eukprot:4178495-Amphidinium_carterae.1